jgi:hypothetical protein
MQLRQYFTDCDCWARAAALLRTVRRFAIDATTGKA